MDLSKVISINGKSGLFEIVGQRNNGVLVKAFSSNKKQFISARTHIFSLIDNISIYTTDEEESAPLYDVFQSMLKNEDSVPIVSPKDGKEALSEYLGQILPAYDRDRVYFSDMKKLVRWYAELKENDFLDLEPRQSAFTEEEATTEEEKGDEKA